jgi:phage shock protein A
MGIFNRLNRVIKSNLNALIDQAEDPEKLIGQTVSDMKSALSRARKELVEALGSAKRLEKKERSSRRKLPSGNERRFSRWSKTMTTSRAKRFGGKLGC